MFVVGGTTPSVSLVARSWAIILALAFAFSINLNFRILSGRYDLIIDSAAALLILLPKLFHKEGKRISFTELDAVLVLRIESSSEDASCPRWVSALQLKDSGKPVRLIELLSRERTESFAEWLAKKSGVPLAFREEI